MIVQQLTDIEIGLPQAFKNITMFPLLTQDSVVTDYLTLDEALAAKSARITEVGEGGTVPELKFFNDGDVPVLLLDGEELVGAKQNRVLNLTIMAPANESINIPVSCVEAGRWSYRSSEFSSSPRSMYAKARAAKHDQVSASLRETGRRRSDQSAIWADISRKASRMSVNSETEAMSDIYQAHDQVVEDFVGRFKAGETQVGVIFGIDSEIVGIDLFDQTDTLVKVLPKLIRSYALDALESEGSDEGLADRDKANAFLRSLTDTKVEKFPAVGMGEDHRFENQSLAGGALVVDDQLVHLWAFPLNQETSTDNERAPSRLSRGSQRRRGH